MLNKHNFNIAQLASKGPGRFTYAGIYVTPQETIETDGHQMVRISAPKVHQEFPKVREIENAVDDFPPFFFPAETALAAAKALPEKVSAPVLKNATVAKQPGGEFVVGITDLKKHSVYPVPQEKRTYPDWQRVMPQRENAKFRTTFNAQLLEKVLATVRKTHGAPKSPAVELSFYGPEKAVRLDWSNADTGQENMAAVMPMRGEQHSEVQISLDIMYAHRRQEEAERMLNEFEQQYMQVGNGRFNERAGDIGRAKRELVKAWREAKKQFNAESAPNVSQDCRREDKPAKIATPEPEPVQKPVQPVQESKQPRSWKPEVQVKGEGDKWYDNSLRFATEAEASANAQELFRRWSLATAHRATATDDPPNYSYIDGELLRLEETKAPAKVIEMPALNSKRLEQRTPVALKSFTERMRAAETTDDGRTIIKEFETAVHDFEVLCKLDPTVGDKGSGFAYRGFSTLKPADRARMIKRVREANPENGDRFAALVNDGVLMESAWKELWDKERESRIESSKPVPAVPSLPVSKPASKPVSLPATPVTKTQRRTAAAIAAAAMTTVAAAVAASKPVFDSTYRTAKFVSHEGLTGAFKKFWKIGQQVEAKREPCESCHGKGSVDGDPCVYCGGTKIQVQIETGPTGEPVVVDPANVSFE